MSAAQKQLQMLCVMTGLQTEAVTVNSLAHQCMLWDHWQSQISPLGPVLFIYGGVYVGSFFTTKMIVALFKKKKIYDLYIFFMYNWLWLGQGQQKHVKGD